MGTIVPLNLIEIVEGAFRKKARIVGTVFTVEEIVAMHLLNGVSIEELVEDYGLTRAGIHAALAYYYTHQDEIDEGIRQHDRLIRENATPLSALIEKAQQRLKEKNG
jgi:uncharacterized protein (DUF433 family)